MPQLTILPPLPGDLAGDPADPGIRPGADARVALAETRRGLAMCRARYGALRRFYLRFTEGGDGR